MKNIQDIHYEWDKLVQASQNYCVGEQIDEVMFNKAMRDAFLYFKETIDFETSKDSYVLPIDAATLLCKVDSYASQACVLYEEETIVFEASQFAATFLYDIVVYKEYFPKDENTTLSSDFNYIDRDGHKPQPAAYDLMNGDLSDMVRLIRWIRECSTCDMG